jgi:hypothetical protein
MIVLNAYKAVVKCLAAADWVAKTTRRNKIGDDNESI